MACLQEDYTNRTAEFATTAGAFCFQGGKGVWGFGRKQALGFPHTNGEPNPACFPSRSWASLMERGMLVSHPPQH